MSMIIGEENGEKFRKPFKDSKLTLEQLKSMDDKIKPLPPKKGTDFVFFIKIPLAIILESDGGYPRDKIQEFSGFIEKEGYEVIGMDKQRGYTVDCYSFFCKLIT